MEKRSQSTINDSSLYPKPSKKSKKGYDAVTINSFAETYQCPITHGLMFDPVVAEDGNTYEREAIQEWLSKNARSPLNPTGMTIKGLIPARQIQIRIVKMIESGIVDKKLTKAWKERKKEADLIKAAQKLFREGSTMEAAKLGLPEAQVMAASMYLFGKHGFEKDADKSMEYLKKGAEGGDMSGQYMLAVSYKTGSGVDRDMSEAILWFEKAAQQGCSKSMYVLGNIYEEGGSELDHNYVQKAASFYEESANAGSCDAQYKIGEFYYNGKGVAKNYKEARKWFEKASQGGRRLDRFKADAEFWLGKMMMKGEGGCTDVSNGIQLISKSASNGYKVGN